MKNRWKHYCCDLYKKNDNITTIITNTDNYGIRHEDPPPLYSEVEKDIREIKKGKSPGIDEIASELIQTGDTNVIRFFHRLCTLIWTKKEWPDD